MLSFKTPLPTPNYSLNNLFNHAFTLFSNFTASPSLSNAEGKLHNALHSTANFLQELSPKAHANLLKGLRILVPTILFGLFRPLVAILLGVILFEIVEICKVQVKLDYWREKRRLCHIKIVELYSGKEKNCKGKEDEDNGRISIQSTQCRSENVLEDSLLESDTISLLSGSSECGPIMESLVL